MISCYNKRGVCEVCGSKDILRKYKILSNGSKVFDKLDIDKLPEVYLYKCKQCKFHFTSPIINEELLADYYSNVDSEYYDNNEKCVRLNPNSTKIVLDIISKYQPTGNILEVGSGRGELLNILSQENYNCYGLEPSPSASAYCMEEYGLNVKNEFVNATNPFGVLFDVIILVDVMEHIINPADFLIKLKAFLRNNGIVIFTTGDISSLNARVLKSKWGYFSSFEHLSFFNKTSVSSLSKSLGLDIICYRKFSHNGSYINNFIRLAKNIVVVPLKNNIKMVLNMFSRRRYKPSMGILSNDHVAVVMRKK